MQSKQSAREQWIIQYLQEHYPGLVAQMRRGGSDAQAAIMANPEAGRAMYRAMPAELRPSPWELLVVQVKSLFHRDG